MYSPLRTDQEMQVKSEKQETESPRFLVYATGFNKVESQQGGNKLTSKSSWKEEDTLCLMLIKRLQK